MNNTIQIINKYSKFISYWESEKDNGIYHAMNKGINLANGDIIGFLNSDDIYFNDNIIECIVKSFNNNIECIYGDIVFVNKINTNKITRLYSAKNFQLNLFSYGHMPPHPSFYALKNLYNKIGLFKTDYKIAADFDFLLRALLIHGAKFKYVNLIFVRMRSGGISSTLKNKMLLNKEIFRSCIENHIKTSYFKIYIKYFFKLKTLFYRKVGF